MSAVSHQIERRQTFLWIISHLSVKDLVMKLLFLLTGGETAFLLTGGETAFASNPRSNKTRGLGNQSCERSNSLSDSSVASRQLKMNSGLRADEDLDGGNSLSSRRESCCGGLVFSVAGGKKKKKIN